MKYSYYLLLFLLFAACKQPQPSGEVKETAISGSINISVDESFKPVISEQLKVFLSSYPKATINAVYKSEADCLRDLQNDSTRLVIISRGLTDNELGYYKQKLEYKPLYGILAYDAIAVITNNANTDSVFTLNQVKEMLTGSAKTPYNVVVDGKNATSTVRYLIDSVLQGKPLGKNVTAAKNSEDVVSYVAANTGAIGFVGVSWVADSDDEKTKSDLARIKMALIECKNCGKDVFAKPSQETIMRGQYPLVRGLYYILKENWSGLGTGFVNFLTIIKLLKLTLSNLLKIPQYHGNQKANPTSRR